jgi:hypothetical protein
MLLCRRVVGIRVCGLWEDLERNRLLRLLVSSGSSSMCCVEGRENLLSTESGVVGGLSVETEATVGEGTTER